MLRKPNKLWMLLMIAAFGLAPSVAIVGCEDDNPAEEIGESIDEAAEEVGDAVEDATD